MFQPNPQFINIKTSTIVTVNTQKGNTFVINETAETFLPINKTLQSTVSVERHKTVPPLKVTAEHKII
jgi:hypothetical protein